MTEQAPGARGATGPRKWVTLYATVFAFCSVLFFCSLVAVVVAAAAAIDGGPDTSDEPGVGGWIFLLIIAFIWYFVAGMIVTTAVALALAHVLISIPAVASTQQSFLTAFAATVAMLPVASVFFARRPGTTLILCIVFAVGNCVIAFRVARFLPRFPATDMGLRESLA